MLKWNAANFWYWQQQICQNRIAEIWDIRRDRRLGWERHRSISYKWTTESWHITDNLLATTFCINYYTAADVNFNGTFYEQTPQRTTYAIYRTHSAATFAKFEASPTAWHFIGYQTINQAIRYAHKSIGFRCEMNEWSRRLSILQRRAARIYHVIIYCRVAFSKIMISSKWWHIEFFIFIGAGCADAILSPRHAMAKFQSSLLNEAWSYARARAGARQWHRISLERISSNTRTSPRAHTHTSNIFNAANGKTCRNGKWQTVLHTDTYINSYMWHSCRILVHANTHIPIYTDNKRVWWKSMIKIFADKSC